MKSFYEILEVSRSASVAEIRTAYLRLAREYHPDRVPEHLTKLRADAEEKLKLVNQAWAVLGDASKRRRYDVVAEGNYQSNEEPRPRPAPVQPNPAPRTSIRDLLRSRQDWGKWVLVVGVLTLIFVVLGEVIALRETGSETVSSNPPAINSKPVEQRVRHYDLKPIHLKGSQSGSLDVQLLSSAYSEEKIDLTFRLRSGERGGFLLYEPPGGSGRTRKILGKEVVVDRGLEEIYLLDNAGAKYYSTTGLVGGKQSNFDLYNFTRRIDLRPHEEAVLTASFPPLTDGATSVTFVSPALMKWQPEWRWPGIDLK